MSFVIDDSFDYFLEKFGQPDLSTPASAEVIEEYRGRLPDRLLEYWQEFGFCRFKKGLFWIVNPNDFADIKNEWLPDEPPKGYPKKDECHVIARTAFGDLMVWSKSEGYCYTIEPLDGRVFLKGRDGKRIKQGMETDSIQMFFGGRRDSNTDKEDVVTDQSIFNYAVKKFGPLEVDEMFTFEPAPFLGGYPETKNVNKVNMHVQLDILTGLADIQLMNLKGLIEQAYLGAGRK